MTTRAQAKALAVKLKNEGKEYAEIAQALEAAGYTSTRTGKPLTAGGVNQMLLAAGHRVRSIRKAKAPPPRRVGSGDAQEGCPSQTRRPPRHLPASRHGPGRAGRARPVAVGGVT